MIGLGGMVVSGTRVSPCPPWWLGYRWRAGWVWCGEVVRVGFVGGSWGEGGGFVGWFVGDFVRMRREGVEVRELSGAVPCSGKPARRTSERPGTRGLTAFDLRKQPLVSGRPCR